MASRSPGLSEAWWRDSARLFERETGVKAGSPLERGLRPGELAKRSRPGLVEAEVLRRGAAEVDRVVRSNCFVAGTLVSTPSGLRAIETIGSGDVVWSFDFRTGRWVECVVAVCH